MYNDLALQLSLLSAEAKRKHPEVKEAADNAIQQLKSNAQTVASELQQGTAKDAVLLQPTLLGCATKNAKVISHAVACLQRLLSAKDGIALAYIPTILSTLKVIANQGVVEVQLKILQTLVSLLQNVRVHGHVLAETLLLCFRLQESKVGVVSSTAAATLRQLVILVFEAVVEEDRNFEDGETGSPSNTDTAKGVGDALPAGSSLRPCATDAYHIFNDLCMLVSATSRDRSIQTAYIKLPTLSKTFGLELIESVLSDFHHTVFSPGAHPDLLALIGSSLCPYLIRDLGASNPTFATTLRLMRVMYLLLKVFDDHLPAECRTFYQMLIRIIGDSSADSSTHPAWMRVLALEIARGLCSDFGLLQRVWQKYDPQEGQSDILYALLNALSRLATEKPALLGVNNTVTNGIVDGASASAAFAMDSIGPKVAEMAAQAVTSVGVGNAAAQQPEFSLNASSVKLQCIDQLDKVEPPVPPETYIFLLSLQCLCAVANGFLNATIPLYQEHNTLRCAADLELSPSAPPAVDFDGTDESLSTLRVLRDMALKSWPPLMSSLSFFLSTNASDDLFQQTLAGFQSFATSIGILDLTTPRDAFLSSLAKFAVPPIVVASARHPQTTSDGNASDVQALLLSARNIQCLMALLALAENLAGTLQTYWYSLFDALQNAEYVLKTRGRVKESQASTHAAISQLFAQSSLVLDDRSFEQFIHALVHLSNDMIGLPEHLTAETHTLKSAEVFKRRASGMALTSVPRSGETSFAIERLGQVATLNVHRLIHRHSNTSWQKITMHLLDVMHWTPTSASIRIQAAETIEGVLEATITSALQSSDVGIQKITEQKVLDCFLKQAADFGSPPSASQNSLADAEIRKRAYLALFKLLETTGHSLLCGWKTVFDILDTSCVDTATSSKDERQTLLLVSVSFPSMQLVCSDFLSALSTEECGMCIRSLHRYAAQTEDLNIALTAANLMWQVSDFLQAARGDSAREEEYSKLWLDLLQRLSVLCVDERQQVREGATQIFFRCLEINGVNLNLRTWQTALWDFVVPAFKQLTENAVSMSDSKERTDSAILYANSFVGILVSFLTTKIATVEKATDIVAILLDHVASLFLSCEKIGAAAARAMDNLATACLAVASDDSDKASMTFARTTMQEIWRVWTKIGVQLSEWSLQRATSPIDQSNLEAYCKAMQPMLRLDTYKKDGSSVQTALEICRTCILWTASDAFRPDVDHLTPLQNIVLTLIQGIELEQRQILLAVANELAYYAQLAYQVSPKGPSTYVALAKASLSLLTSIYLSHESDSAFYKGDILPNLIQAYAVPMRQKFNCPPASKFGSDAPLWRSTTLQFLRVGPTIARRLSAAQKMGEGWKKLLDCYCSALLADRSTLQDNSDLQDVRKIEDFDLALLCQIELEILPLAIASDIPDSDLLIIPASLQAASKLYHLRAHIQGDASAEEPSSPKSKRFSRASASLSMYQTTDTDASTSLLNTPCERLAYWSFDLLFLCCSAEGLDITETNKRRLSKIALPFLMDKVVDILRTFVSDAANCGCMPFPRIRNDEVVYVLQNLLRLRLLPGVFAEVYPANGSDVSGPQQALRESPLAHLFRLFHHLLSLARYSSTQSLTSKDKPYRLAPVSQAILGLPEGIAIGKIGRPRQDSDMPELRRDAWDTQELARRCLQEMSPILTV